MINKSAIGNQLSAVGYQQNLQHRNIEDLKGRKDPEALQAAAKELEALFAYEMIKAMRQTTETGKSGFGKDAYMSLFDTELSRIFADRGLGLKDVLLKGLNRQAAKAGNQQSDRIQESGVRSQDIGATQQSAISNQQPATSNQGLTAGIQDKGSRSQEIKAGSQGMTAGIQKSEFRSLETGPLPLTPVPQTVVPASASVDPNIPVDGVISSKFGMRKHPVHGDSRFHHGMDIAAPVGTEVYPYQSGKVIFSGGQPGYGNTIVIDHGNGYTSKYAHNRINLVKAGDSVNEDTIIAEVGSTGLSTGPHLHFEVRRDGKYLDPARVLALK